MCLYSLLHRIVFCVPDTKLSMGKLDREKVSFPRRHHRLFRPIILHHSSSSFILSSSFLSITHLFFILLWGKDNVISGTRKPVIYQQSQTLITLSSLLGLASQFRLWSLESIPMELVANIVCSILMAVIIGLFIGQREKGT